jgi:large subunit ribosomal protein L5
MTRLREEYNKTIEAELGKELGLTNRFQVPRLEKVVINIGVGDAKDNKKALEAVVKNVATITGQKPVVTKAKKSIAGFKIRAGQPIGVRATLRDDRMFDFIDKLVTITLPRVRDFRGLSLKGFDGKGNYNLGIKEHVIFPEIQFEEVEKNHGLNITVVTTAETDAQGIALLKKLGFPFEKEA